MKRNLSSEDFLLFCLTTVFNKYPKLEEYFELLGESKCILTV